MKLESNTANSQSYGRLIVVNITAELQRFMLSFRLLSCIELFRSDVRFDTVAQKRVWHYSYRWPLQIAVINQSYRYNILLLLQHISTSQTEYNE